MNTKLRRYFQVRTVRRHCDTIFRFVLLRGLLARACRSKFASGLVLRFKISQALLAVDQIHWQFVVVSTVLASVCRRRCLVARGNRADSAVIRVPQREAHPKHVSQPAVHGRRSALGPPSDIFISNFLVISHARIQTEVVEAFAVVHLAPTRANVCRRSFLSRCYV